MPFIALFILCLAVVSCDKKVVESVDVPAEDVAVAEVPTGETPWSGESDVREGSDYPAVYISWHDVQAFIGRLNAAAGDSLYRLPSEAEWEYACRAGTNTRWAFGDDESDLTYYAWYRDNAHAWGERYGHKVGMLLPNPWGLHDMHGNVWEWVQDWYSYYTNRVTRLDPLGPLSSADGSKVIRGGSLSADRLGERSASRASQNPNSRSWGQGVRLVRMLSP